MAEEAPRTAPMMSSCSVTFYPTFTAMILSSRHLISIALSVWTLSDHVASSAKVTPSPVTMTSCRTGTTAVARCSLGAGRLAARKLPSFTSCQPSGSRTAFTLGLGPGGGPADADRGVFRTHEDAQRA